jgi:hypothetical protein
MCGGGATFLFCDSEVFSRKTDLSFFRGGGGGVTPGGGSRYTC